MGIRPDLLRWQYSDYHAKHANARNLVIHILAVPLFWAGLAGVAWSVYAGHLVCGFGSALALGVSFVLQGLGHKKFEREEPAPFLGPADFVSRFFVEQTVTFPRFVLSGGWWRGMRK